MIIGLGIGIPFIHNYAYSTFQPFDPSTLFANGEPGAWYDPSDLTTLYQDAAGTTPVTAVEQPVGLMLDKSGRGNHAFQTTATSRPVLSARYNLLTKTEQFNDGAWLKSGVTSTASKITPSTGNNFHNTAQPVTYVATGYTAVIEAKADGYQYLQLLVIAGASYVEGVFNLSGAGAVENTSRNSTWTGTRSIEPLPDGYYRCTVTVATASAASGSYQIGVFPTNNSNAAFAGDGTSGILVRKADIRPSNQADLPYQRVNTATDYDAGPAFPRYLRCDGIDDWMVTGTITPGTDKVQVFAGVRKLSDAAPGMLMEFNFNIINSAGSFYISAPEDPSKKYASLARGIAGAASAQMATTGSLGIAPDTAVLASSHDIAGDLSTIRRNGVAGTSGTGDKGAGNFLAYPLYLFRRGGTTLPFNGHFYGGIIRFGPNLPIETIEQTEAYMAAKTGVTL